MSSLLRFYILVLLPHVDNFSTPTLFRWHQLFPAIFLIVVSSPSATLTLSKSAELRRTKTIFCWANFYEAKAIRISVGSSRIDEILVKISMLVQGRKMESCLFWTTMSTESFNCLKFRNFRHGRRICMCSMISFLYIFHFIHFAPTSGLNLSLIKH